MRTPTQPPTQPLLGLLLRLANQRWAAEMDAELERLGVRGLTAAHARVLPFVPPEGASVQTLASKANVRKQTMAQSVDQLVAAGVVERRPDPSDRRVSLVVLTEAGRAITPTSHAAGAAVEQEWAAQLGEGRLEDLRSILTELVGLARPH
ncbi:MarR family winged helix-turn-helix transcriptional regulator [Xylanimonas sp. McL0601]|uniref:MarR family winged helix-turn-helix transcriptional regulator n=1 Tax=Xylanimonas sp. McL0601 TaxID=3414739 RepID=UPI003CF95041